MDIKEYYRDLHKTAAELERKNPERIVHVTSVYNREKNATAGCTLSATPENAARVITDGTHREATKEEVAAFLTLQENNRIKAVKSEQAKNKQFVVVLDPDQRSALTGNGGVAAGSAEGKALATK